jgi:hypothetical protein
MKGMLSLNRLPRLVGSEAGAADQASRQAHPRLPPWVEGAGYSGFHEVEIFSELDWWKRDPDEVLRVCKERHLEAS